MKIKRGLPKGCIAICLVALLTTTGWTAPVAKPIATPLSPAVTAVMSETRARFPWYASVQAYDVDIRAIAAAISQRASQLEFSLPLYGQVRFELQRLDLSSSTPLWSGASQQGDKIFFGFDAVEQSITAHLQMRDGKYWRIEQLSNNSQHFLVNIDSTKLPRGNDALPVLPRTPPPGRPSGTSPAPHSRLPAGLLLQRAPLNSSLPPGLVLNVCFTTGQAACLTGVHEKAVR